MSDKSFRYDTWHKNLNSHSCFYLKSYKLEIEDCRLILLKVLDQAKQDVVNYSNSNIPFQKEIWQNAKDFLFNNNYTINWGGEDFYLQDIVSFFGMSVSCLRKEIIEKIKEKIEKKDKKDGKKRKRKCRRNKKRRKS